MKVDILALLVFFGTALGILMSAGQLIINRRKPVNYFLAALFLILGLFNGYIFSMQTRMLMNHMWLTDLHLPLLFLTGPLLFGIYQVSLKDDYRPGRKDIIHLTVILSAVVILFILWQRPAKMKLENATLLMAGQSNGMAGITFLSALVINFLYVTLIAYKTRYMLKFSVLKEQWSARILVFIIFATTISLTCGLLFYFTEQLYWRDISGILFTGALVIAYLIGHRYPQFFQSLHEVAVEQKPARTLLKGDVIQKIEAGLKQLFEDEEIFRDENLTLTATAEEIGVSLHQLSEYINQHLGKNFATFVNHYRIEAARRDLVAHADRPLLQIAYDAGFNSKSAFHRAFTRFTGTTPTRYREKYGSGNL